MICNTAEQVVHEIPMAKYGFLICCGGILWVSYDRNIFFFERVFFFLSNEV